MGPWYYGASLLNALNIKTRTLRDGKVINLSYDAQNRLTLKNPANPGAADYDITYTHDNLGRNLTASSTGSFSNHSYDALSRFTAEAAAFMLQIT